jgi:tRNA (guanine-N7-)-methyltransferase
VLSGQAGPHADLERTVRRHLGAPFRRPIGAASAAVYEGFRARWDGRTPLVFDSGCGVGDSTRRLAARFPDALVVGIDKSDDRLRRERPAPLPPNALLLRADLVDFWRLAASDGIRLARHYLLYPNPWPKVGHLQRRWHGHAVFPALLDLGGVIELRSNWATYVEEFAIALQAARTPETCKLATDVLGADELADPLTPFERKYAASGQTLHRLLAELRP